MTWEQYFTGAVMVALIGALVSRRIGPDIAFLCALAAFLVVGILEPEDAVAGFANPAVITVGLLYVVAMGLKETGGMTTIMRRWLGRPRSPLGAQTRLLLPVAGLSAFVNNTPVVAMFLPTLRKWATQNQLHASQLFMPLSFAAMLGGMCTLIGTSTNLVVNQMMADPARDLQTFGMFTLAWVGLPAMVLGLAYILIFGRRLLPEGKPATEVGDDPRDYTVWMRVEPGSPIVGSTIEDAGLRHLTGLFVAEIQRGDEMIVAPGPHHVLRKDDRIKFVGVVESVVELRQTKGLVPDTEELDKLEAPQRQRRLIEAVVSEASPLVGKSVREGGFRTRYSAVIFAVHRAGERVKGKIGDIVLRPGDTLLLEAHPGFARQHRNSSAFYLVSELRQSPAPNWKLAWVALGILAGLVASITSGAHVMVAALCAAMLMILTRCCTGTQARRAIDWQVLIVIGAAFGVASAMEKSGLATSIGDAVLGWAGGYGMHALLGGVYLLTVLFTSVMTNNAAAALVFPIAYQVATAQDLAFMPFAACIALGASAAFATPVSYQTNLMVMGPGRYSWGDFLRFGGPLTVLCGIVCVLLAPLVYQ